MIQCDACSMKLAILLLFCWIYRSASAQCYGGRDVPVGISCFDGYAGRYFSADQAMYCTCNTNCYPIDVVCTRRGSNSKVYYEWRAQKQCPEQYENIYHRIEGGDLMLASYANAQYTFACEAGYTLIGNQTLQRDYVTCNKGIMTFQHGQVQGCGLCQEDFSALDDLRCPDKKPSYFFSGTELNCACKTNCYPVKVKCTRYSQHGINYGKWTAQETCPEQDKLYAYKVHPNKDRMYVSRNQEKYFFQCKDGYKLVGHYSLTKDDVTCHDGIIQFKETQKCVDRTKTIVSELPKISQTPTTEESNKNLSTAGVIIEVATNTPEQNATSSAPKNIPPNVSQTKAIRVTTIPSKTAESNANPERGTNAQDSTISISERTTSSITSETPTTTTLSTTHASTTTSSSSSTRTETTTTPKPTTTSRPTKISEHTTTITKSSIANTRSPSMDDMLHIVNIGLAVVLAILVIANTLMIYSCIKKHGPPDCLCSTCCKSDQASETQDNLGMPMQHVRAH